MNNDRVVSEVIINNFTDETELRYVDTGDSYVDLYHQFNFEGFAKVYVDQIDREYIIVNDEDVYLDTINKIE